MDSTTTADPLIGTAIGSYEVVRRLGEGGMGAVYEIRHPGIGKRLALKLLHQQFSSQPEMVRRFFDEARAVNLIGHPNIVDILDFSELPDGRPYLMMEYLEGEDLTTRLARAGRSPPREVLEIARPVCSALAAAHAVGITHRDLKPDNLFIEAQGRVVVLDFGIAKLSPELSGAGPTATGTLMGTPSYMAPEQATGQVRAIGPWTDVYALGCIVYEMLTGTPPFSAPTLAALIHKQAYEHAAPLRERRPDLAPGWNRIVMTALAKDPARRFAHAGEFAAALERTDQPDAASLATVVARPINAAPAPTMSGPTRWVIPVIAALMLLASAAAVYFILTS